MGAYFLEGARPMSETTFVVIYVAAAIYIANEVCKDLSCNNGGERRSLFTMIIRRFRK